MSVPVAVSTDAVCEVVCLVLGRSVSDTIPDGILIETVVLVPERLFSDA